MPPHAAGDACDDASRGGAHLPRSPTVTYLLYYRRACDSIQVPARKEAQDFGVSEGGALTHGRSGGVPVHIEQTKLRTDEIRLTNDGTGQGGYGLCM